VKIRGIEITLHSNEDLSNHIRRENDFFEAEILDYIRDSFPKQHTILDIGANIGNHSVYFANFLKYISIVAFEPIPANLGLLVGNLQPYTGIYVVPYALSDKREVIPMTEKLDNMGMSGYDTNGKILAEAYPLDFFNYNNVTLMKIDVENMEPKVLLGAKETIQRCKPLILIEDNFNTYSGLLPDYECINGWEISKTYLYKWRSK